ncbi:S41 family peptidase [Foetidibacter luteolus]|uniref:S41 family peptidase n=1 Tax=Foetidibacter luteolus TaxID=2608880 RepID=UPI001A989DB9|nr:S41 family peptidase [Foetidibacter luteolus]
MKQLFITLFLVSGLFYSAISQDYQKSANDGFVVTRMVEKFHIAPKPTDNAFSENLWQQVIESLDDERIYFTAGDLMLLNSWKQQLDEQVLQRKTDFLVLLGGLYQKRLQKVDSLLADVCKKPFDFSVDEYYTAKEDSSWPQAEAEAKAKITRIIKWNVLEALQEEYPGKNLNKQFLDTAQLVFQKKVASAYKREISSILNSPGGVPKHIGDAWCSAIALYYDPHTEYFPLTEKENFDAALGQQPYRFGFRTRRAKDKGVVIDELEPGSPAFKSGMLNKGDKFETIQWEGKQPIDVSDAAPRELGKMLDESNHDKLSITVKKADGTTRTVTLVKEMVEEQEEDDDDKVKSFLLKGSKVVGYISLPAFYSDWENEEEGVKGCANDVAKEILKLKKENITGLILDLRFNGGGSLQEAAELTGIFIDGGPVHQLKPKAGKIFTLKDVNRGTIYDGPLLVLVNGYSASASEMVAGALRDYNRALIVGSSTYGKATGQVVFPMDTTVAIETIHEKQSESYIKITTGQLFRIDGSTAQFAGVKPDVELPGLLEAQSNKEADEKFALKPTTIEANKYYKAYPPLPVASLQQLAKNIADTSAWFKSLKKYLQVKGQQKEWEDISLKWAPVKEEAEDTDFPEPGQATYFKIENNAYELEKLKANDGLRQLNDFFKNYLLHDAYLEISYRLLLQM